MKNLWLIIVILISIGGCASKEEQMAYYRAVEKQAQVINDTNQIAAVQQAIETNRHQEVLIDMAQKSMASAARTPGTSDDLLIPILMMLMQQNQKEVQHAPQMKLPTIEPPDQFSDVLEASTPILKTGLYAGLGTWGLTELFNAIGGETINYALSGGSKLNIDSQNSGSKNSAGGDLTSTGSTTINDESQSCDGCDEPDFKGRDIQFPDKGDIDFDLKSCQEEPPGGINEAGTPLWDVDCSCQSHFENKC